MFVLGSGRWAVTFVFYIWGNLLDRVIASLRGERCNHHKRHILVGTNSALATFSLIKMFKCVTILSKSLGY